MDLIRNASVEDARIILKFHPTKASDLLLKVLDSVVANARNNLSLNEKDLYVSEVYANEGATMKRMRWVAMGRVNDINKKTTHLVIGLSERAK